MVVGSMVVGNSTPFLNIKVKETLERWFRISSAFDRTTGKSDSAETPEKSLEFITF